MQAKDYLARIGVSTPGSVDFLTLKTLHLLHLQNVPFENLDIHANRAIELNEAKLFDKIIVRRRGGICYELNGMFAWLLGELGFDVVMIAANVYSEQAELSPDFDHMVLIVTLDRTGYLVDVGFGDSFLVPVHLAKRGADADDAPAYEISQTAGASTLSRLRLVDNARSTKPLFRFELTPRLFGDFAERCDFHQYSNESHFRRKPLCSRALSDGRITLSGDALIVSRGPAREVTRLSDAHEANRALRDHFGVEL